MKKNSVADDVVKLETFHFNVYGRSLSCLVFAGQRRHSLQDKGVNAFSISQSHENLVFSCLINIKK